MGQYRRLTASGVASVFLGGGCTMTPEQQQQLMGGLGGAAVGAATGAVIAGATGRDVGKGAAIGAASGAVVGWGVVKLAQYNAQRTRSANEVSQIYAYDRTQGTLVRMRGAHADPSRPGRGAPVAFVTDYAVLAPGASPVPVTESWELWKDGNLLTSMPPQRVQREPGEWVSRASIDIPTDAAPGTYVVKHRVETGGSYDERESNFVVGEAARRRARSS